MASSRLSGSLKILCAIILTLLLIITCWRSPRAAAAVSLVQKNASTTTSGTTQTVTFGSAPSAGDLLIAVCSSNGAVTITAPSGYSTAINESGDPAQAIFYKVATGSGETSVSCTYSASTPTGMQIYDYSGLHTYMTFEAVNAASSSGSGTSASSGTVTTAHANDLLFAAIASDTNTTTSAWSNSFTQENNSTIGGSPSRRSSFGTADLTVSSAGSYSTTATVGSAAWRGQIAAFRALAASPSLGVDIVNGSGGSISGPSVSLTTLNRGFTCQTASGTLGTSTQKIRVTNSSDDPAWTVALAATSGPSSTWTSGTNSFTYNNPAGSGCSGGQLSASVASATLTPAAGCPSTGVSLGPNASFSSGVTNSLTLASATSPAYIDCYWDITNIPLSQTIPATQISGSYSLNMTITATAN